MASERGPEQQVVGLPEFLVFEEDLTSVIHPDSTLSPTVLTVHPHTEHKTHQDLCARSLLAGKWAIADRAGRVACT